DDVEEIAVAGDEVAARQHGADDAAGEISTRRERRRRRLAHGPTGERTEHAVGRRIEQALRDQPRLDIARALPRGCGRGFRRRRRGWWQTFSGRSSPPLGAGSRSAANERQQGGEKRFHRYLQNEKAA